MGYWDAAAQGARVGNDIGANMYPDGSPLEVEAKQQQLALRDAELQNVPLEMESKRQQNLLRGLTLQQQQQAVTESTRQLALAAGMRQAAAKAQATPASTATTENGGYTPVPADPAGSFASARALIGSPSEYRTQAYDPAKTFGDNDLPAGVTTIPQEKYNAETAGPLNYTPAAPFNPLEAQLQEKAARDAQPKAMTVTTPGAPANPLKAQIEYLNSVGETQKAQELVNTLMDHANKVLTLTGNPNDALKIINDATGEKLAYSPLASLDAVTSDGQLVGYIDKNKYRELTTAGAQPLAAMKGAMVPLDLGGGGKAVMEYLSSHPNATDAELAGVGEKAGVSLSKMIPLLAERQKVAAMKAADERQLRSQAASDARQERSIAAADARQNKTIAAIAARQGTTHPTNGGLTDQAVEDAAAMYNITGTLPSGRNKEANAAIQNRAAELRKASGQTAAGVVANAGDLKALQETIKAQEKQVGSMGSFVKNIDKQVNRFEQISKELSTADARLLNVPLRALRGKVAGSPLQAKVDMYLAEISSETGKLASGATGSVAELSQGAREKWEKIHDPNLSMADLLNVLKETRHAGAMRIDSVREQLEETRKKRGTIGAPATAATVAPAGTKVAKKGGGFYTSDGKGGWY